jgi:hypothetical protein
VAADPSKPLVAAHFHGQGRLEALVLGPAGDATTAGADIRLLSARKLVDLERRLGDLEAPAFNSLDVSAWPTAEALELGFAPVRALLGGALRSAGGRGEEGEEQSCAPRHNGAGIAQERAAQRRAPAGEG